MKDSDTVGDADRDGGRNELFPRTRWSLVAQTLEGDDREAALEELCRLYWAPVYFFIRKRGFSEHDAEDLTQAFFARALHQGQFERAAACPEGGRLRSYLLKSVQNFLINEHRKSAAAKRGGGRELISIDAEPLERLYAQALEGSPEEMFDRRWAENLLERAFTKLESEYVRAGKKREFGVLRGTVSRASGAPSFAEMGRQLGLREGAVRVAAFRLRRQFQAIVRDLIAETTVNESDFEEEFTHLKKLLGG